MLLRWLGVDNNPKTIVSLRLLVLFFFLLDRRLDSCDHGIYIVRNYRADRVRETFSHAIPLSIEMSISSAIAVDRRKKRRSGFIIKKRKKVKWDNFLLDRAYTIERKFEKLLKNPLNHIRNQLLVFKKGEITYRNQHNL